MVPQLVMGFRTDREPKSKRDWVAPGGRPPAWKAELVIPRGEEELPALLAQVAESQSWAVGDDPDAVRRGAVVLRPRALATSYLITGTGPVVDEAWLEGLARRVAERVALVTDSLVERTGGEETLRLDGRLNGHLHGTPWSALWPSESDGRVPLRVPHRLTPALLYELRDTDDPEALPGLLADHLYGRPRPPAPGMVCALHARCDASLVDELAPLLSAVRAHVRAHGRAEIVGFCKVVAANDGGVVGLRLARDPALPDLDLSAWITDRSARAAAEGALRRAFGAALERGVDVKLDQGLALVRVDRDGYEGLHPHTGERVVVPGRRTVTLEGS